MKIRGFEVYLLWGNVCGPFAFCFQVQLLTIDLHFGSHDNPSMQLSIIYAFAFWHWWIHFQTTSMQRHCNPPNTISSNMCHVNKLQLVFNVKCHVSYQDPRLQHQGMDVPWFSGCIEILWLNCLQLDLLVMDVWLGCWLQRFIVEREIYTLCWFLAITMVKTHLYPI